MARNRELLSDKDFFAKTKHIVEHVRNCKIDLVYWRDENWVQDVNLNNSGSTHGKHFRVNIATPAVKGIEKFTALNHELGHVLMRSPMTEAKELINKWLEDDYNNLDEKEINKKYNIFWNTFNVLEDQRIESLMGRLWLANIKRFKTAKRKLGKLHKKVNSNPVNILLMIRFFRPELVEKTKYYDELKTALNTVENTGKYGALLQLRRLKPILDEYFETKNKRKKFLETKLKGDNNLSKNKREELHEELQECKEVDMPKEANTPRFSAQKIDDPENWDDMMEKLTDDELTDNELDDMEDEMEDDGDNELSDIKESMSDGSSVDMTPSYVLRVGRTGVNTNLPDKKVSKQLKSVFRRITEIHKPKIGYDGDDIDTEVYIENKARGSDLTKCFIDKKLEQGASILISIDGSGSMRHAGKIDEVRELVTTLFDSVEDYSNVDLKANIWSSNYKGDVGITDINNKEDCKYIVTENDGRCSFTPTHLALDYSAKQISKMKGRKKILILITDGNPEYSNNNYKLKRNVLSIMCKKAFLKAKRSTENIMILHVTGSGCNSTVKGKRCYYYPSMCNGCYTKDYLSECFGKRHVTSVPSMKHASDKVVHQFREIVTRVLSM